LLLVLPLCTILWNNYAIVHLSTTKQYVADVNKKDQRVYLSWSFLF